MSSEFLQQMLAGKSFESEVGSQGNLVELDTEIEQTATAEEQGELVELTSEINQAVNGAVAMEGLVARFKARGHIDQAALEDYRYSVEAVITASNFQVSAKAITPSFEGEKTTFEYSSEAEEATKGMLQKIWEWIKAKLKQLAALVGRIAARVKAAAGKLGEKILGVKKSIADKIPKKGPVKLPSGAVRYLVDASGKPVDFSAAVGKVLAGTPRAVTDIREGFFSGVKAVDLKALNGVAKTQAIDFLVGSKINCSGGSSGNSAVGFTMTIKLPEASGDLDFKTSSVSTVNSGLDKISAHVKKSATDLEALQTKIEALSNSSETGSAEVSGDIKGAIGSLTAAILASARGMVDEEVKTATALASYAAVCFE